MQIKFRIEAGYPLALYGLSLSYKDQQIPPEEWWCTGVRVAVRTWSDCEYAPCDKCHIHAREQKIAKRAVATANMGLGHDKFLRQIFLGVDIQAPLSWWKQFDTYKVGTVASSESTMHTLHKRDLLLADCEPTVQPLLIEAFNAFKNGIVQRTTEELNDNLPLGFKQRRWVTLNYAVVCAIISQRKNHKLGHYWGECFVDPAYKQLEHPELLPKR